MAFLDETGLAELWSLTKTLANSKAVIETGTYTGGGAYGSANPNTLAFSFTPKVVFIGTTPESTTSTATTAALPFVYNSTAAMSFGISSGTKAISLTWSGNTLSWWNKDSAAAQLNTSGMTYYWVAIT